MDQSCKTESEIVKVMLLMHLFLFLKYQFISLGTKTIYLLDTCEINDVGYIVF